MKGFGGIQQLMKQANQMQLKMKKLQEDFATRTFTATAGGGAVEVTVLGENQIKSVVINKDVFSDGDAEMLQDMIVLATNDALTKSREEYKLATEKITGGINLPGMM
jgi:nucleoid-associated protein EbfC